MPGERPPEYERRSIVAIVVDDRGWMVCGTVDGVAVESPEPTTARTAADYLRHWPELWNEPRGES
ncbi:hypothetical protein [Pseudonocardia zijingensis]|uniref:Uncharacterized protein n=1 Tax=Pseudonocardia zijingensis TaxID=153376 RepID=A0ABP3YZI3_9PSEU